MGTFGEEAQGYEAKQRLNIADLEMVSISLPLETKTGTNKDGEEYTYKAYVDGNIEYYVPYVVLGQVQEILKLKPTATKFKVKKTGTGLATKYKVEVVE